MDEVAEVKSRLEITEVIGAYLPLKQAGRNLKAPCPFHQEKTGSFMVSPEKGIYHCFGCGEGGDIFSFVMKMEGMDFKQALEMLARKAGVELTAKKGESQEVNRLRARLLEAHELAVKYYLASLVQNKNALEYVSQTRHLTRETVKAFGIGYAPDSWNALTDFLVKNGFTQRELLQGGLAGQKEGRNTIYDLFRGRVMFSICDREGRPVGFTGRVLDDGVPKYLNTPQTPLYDKSTVIYGLHLAKEAIRSSDEVVLVEGNMDVVASHQAGVKQVVAASGTALTLDQLRTLSKLTKNIKLAFDSDRAGIAATERAIELGQKLGLTLRMVEVPDAKDADELIQKNGVEAWQKAISDAKYIVDYLFDRFEKDFDLTSAVGKRGYADRLAANLRRLGDPVEQDHYVKLLAEKTGTSEEAVKAKIEQGDVEIGVGASTKAGHSAEQPVRRAVEQVSGRPSAETQRQEQLLAITLTTMDARISLDDLYADCFSSAKSRSVYEFLVNNTKEDAQQFVSSHQDLSVFINQLLMIYEQEFQDTPKEKMPILAFELSKTVLKDYLFHVKRGLTDKLRVAEQAKDVTEVARLQSQYQNVLDRENS